MYEDWLREQLDGKPHGTKGTLAEHMGIDGSKLSKTLKGERELSARELQRAVDFFGVAPEEFRMPILVPIDGKVAAGPDSSVVFAASDKDLGEAEAPTNATKSTRALEVEGGSMRGYAEDGSLIFYDEPLAPTEDHVGELCVCWLEDGRVMVKLPYPGTKPGLWHLESTTAETRRDVPIRRMAHVISIVPRRAARTLIRRRVDIRPVDTVVER